jgi:hypothetical protein
MYAIAADRGNRRARALFVSKKANSTLKEGKRMKFSRMAGGQAVLLLGAVIALVCVGSARAVSAASVVNKPALTPVEWRQLMALENTLDEYAALKGRFAHLADLQAEGYLFFDLKNPQTGERLSEACESAVPGAICIQLSNPYTFEGLRDYDREGTARILIHNKFGGPWRTIPEEERDRTSWYSLYRVAKEKGYTEGELKLVMLGVILSRSISPSEGLETFRQEPFNAIIDPITGERLVYSDGGFGSRVQIVPPAEAGAPIQLRVMLDGKVVYAAEISALGSRQTPNGFVSGGTRIVYLPPLGKKRPIVDDAVP